MQLELWLYETITFTVDQSYCDLLGQGRCEWQSPAE